MTLVCMSSKGEKVIDVAGDRMSFSIRHYEILRKEHPRVRSGSFPCLALEVEPKRVTMHGFITFNGNTLQSEIAFVAKPLESKRSNADIITFLQRLRGGVLQLVEEWKKHDYQMPLIHHPEFAPDRFEN